VAKAVYRKQRATQEGARAKIPSRTPIPVTYFSARPHLLKFLEFLKMAPPAEDQIQHTSGNRLYSNHNSSELEKTAADYILVTPSEADGTRN
jgi:hypothetical protein